VEIFYKSEDGSTWNSESDAKAWNCVVAAQRYYDQKDWDGAIEMCTRGLAYSPSVYEITLSLYRGLGLAQYGKGDYDAAIATFNVPLNNDSANRMGWNNARHFTGNLRTNVVSIYYNRGRAYLQKDMYEEASADYKTCIAFCDVYQDEKNLAQYRDAAGERLASVPYDQGLAAAGEGDYAKALKLYQKAADMGNSSGIMNIGVLYYQGQGVPKDEAKAVELFRKAADMGNANAMSNLGTCYATGNGVQKDLKKAVEWFKKAVANGNENSKKFLAKAEAELAKL